MRETVVKQLKNNERTDSNKRLYILDMPVKANETLDAKL